jgi:hypothetical protein
MSVLCSFNCAISTGGWGLFCSKYFTLCLLIIILLCCKILWSCFWYFSVGSLVSVDILYTHKVEHLLQWITLYMWKKYTLLCAFFLSALLSQTGYNFISTLVFRIVLHWAWITTEEMERTVTAWMIGMAMTHEHMKKESRNRNVSNSPKYDDINSKFTRIWNFFMCI